MAHVAPTVPESFQCRKKTGTSSIHPRQFIDENHLTCSVVACFQETLKQEECLHPRLGLSNVFHALTKKREVEILQLVSKGYLTATVIRRQSGMMKHHVVMKHLIYQECLADTTTAIYGNKLSPTTLVVTPQFSYLPFPTNYITHNSSCCLHRKFTRKSQNNEGKRCLFRYERSKNGFVAE